MAGWLAVEDWSGKVYALPDPPVVLARVDRLGEAAETRVSLFAVDRDGKTCEVYIDCSYIGGAGGPWSTPLRAIEEGLESLRQKSKRAAAARTSIEDRVAG